MDHPNHQKTVTILANGKIESSYEWTDSGVSQNICYCGPDAIAIYSAETGKEPPTSHLNVLMICTGGHLVKPAQTKEEMKEELKLARSLAMDWIFY